jgi:hypothetical protein
MHTVYTAISLQTDCNQDVPVPRFTTQIFTACEKKNVQIFQEKTMNLFLLQRRWESGRAAVAAKAGRQAVYQWAKGRAAQHGITLEMKTVTRK